MKAIKRKLLSLVLAMAMVLSLAPTALAAKGDSNDPIDVDNALDVTAEYANGAITYRANYTASPGSSINYVVNPNSTYTWSYTGGSITTPTATSGGSLRVTPGATDQTYTFTASVPATVTTTGADGNSVTKYYRLTGTGEVTVPAATVAKGSITLSGTVGTGTSVLGTAPNYTLSMTSGETAYITALATTEGVAIDAESANSNVVSVARPNGGNAFTLTAKNVNTPTEVKITFSRSDATSATLTVTVSAPSNSATLTPSISTIAVGGTQTLTVNNIYGYDYDYISWNVTQGKNCVSYVTTTTGNTNVFTGYAVGTATITASLVKSPSVVYTTNSVTINVGSAGASLSGIPSSGSTVPLSTWNGYDNIRSHTFSVTPSFNNLSGAALTNAYTITYNWYLGTSSYPQNYHLTSYASSSSYTLYSNESGLYHNGYTNNVLTCIATFTEKATGHSTSASAYWYIGSSYTGSVFATATVYRSSGSYALGELDDAGKSSIVSQLDSYFYNYGTYRYGYGLSHVVFTNTKDSATGSSLSATAGSSYYVNNRNVGTSYYNLSNVLLYPGTTTGTATFPIRAYYYTSATYNTTDYVEGTITFAITGEAYNGDITYSASIGSDVPFVLKDFEDFYYKKTYGSLSYVSFTLPSGGVLYADGGRLNSSNACYAAPNRSQTDLAGVYFSPSGTTATRANTVRISFTAYGTRSNTNGTVAITYLAGSAKDITYNIYSSGALKANDFTDAYRQVLGSTAPNGLTIEFQSAPTNGTLSYKDSSRANSTVVTLRSSNIKSYKFSTLSTGTNQLGDVTYTASGNRSDTIEYIAYVNNTPQFTGKVVFNGSNNSAANMQVGFTSTNGQSVTFSYTEFSRANAAVIAMTSYIRFVTMPTGGTLTYNGAVMTLSSTNVPPTSLGSVSYRPSAGFNNSTDRISFLCYDANGNSVGGGQVSIVVTGNTSSSNGASNVNQFKDVSATAWYRDDLSRLMNAGIIQGRGDGKFDPTAELTYGEALKIFMLASGYPKQTEASGKDWAINYKNLAVSNGWISSNVDLSAKISRNSMAELAAKSLGVSPTDGVPPVWTDGTSNGYSNALYYTNPQILIGNGDGTFNGTSTLRRQEICAIASRVLTYKSNQISTEKPGWIG